VSNITGLVDGMQLVYAPRPLHLIMRMIKFELMMFTCLWYLCLI